MHRPSSAKLWHIPHPPTVFPTPPEELRRTVPLEEHDTSYFAVFDYTTNRDLTDQLIVVKTDDHGNLDHLSWES